METHGLDTESHVFFYEQDFYVLSNFSSFRLRFNREPGFAGIDFDTAEHAYHYQKFVLCLGDAAEEARNAILLARSAHDAYKVAQEYAYCRRPDWDSVKVGVMLEILKAKVQQHEYVRKKLLSTGSRTLVENSWRDDFWGWGPDQKGTNMLGILWMRVREWLQNQDVLDQAAIWAQSQMKTYREAREKQAGIQNQEVPVEEARELLRLPTRCDCGEPLKFEIGEVTTEGYGPPGKLWRARANYHNICAKCNREQWIRTKQGKILEAGYGKPSRRN